MSTHKRPVSSSSPDGVDIQSTLRYGTIEKNVYFKILGVSQRECVVRSHLDGGNILVFRSASSTDLIYLAPWPFWVINIGCHQGRLNTERALDEIVRVAQRLGEYRRTAATGNEGSP